MSASVAATASDLHVIDVHTALAQYAHCRQALSSEQLVPESCAECRNHYTSLPFGRKPQVASRQQRCSAAWHEPDAVGAARRSANSGVRRTQSQIEFRRAFIPRRMVAAMCQRNDSPSLAQHRPQEPPTDAVARKGNRLPTAALSPGAPISSNAKEVTTIDEFTADPGTMAGRR